MEEKRITLSEIAKHLGVATSTVSRALSGKGRVNEQTWGRIRKAATEMGCQEDAFLFMLMAQLKKRPSQAPVQAVMAWLSFAPEPDYFSGASPLDAYYREAKRMAIQRGYDLTEFWLGDESLTAKRLNQILEARGIEGVLIAPYAKFDVTWNLDWSRLVPCAIEFTPFQQELPRIGIYDFYNITRILNQFKADGYERIAYVVRPLHEMNQFYIMQARFAMLALETPEQDRILGLTPRAESTYIKGVWHQGTTS